MLAWKGRAVAILLWGQSIARQGRSDEVAFECLGQIFFWTPWNATYVSWMFAISRPVSGSLRMWNFTISITLSQHVHQKHTWYFWLGHALLGLLWWQLHQQHQHGRLEVQGASELMNGKCSKTHKNLRFTKYGHFRAKIRESMITRHLGFEGFHCTNIPKHPNGTLQRDRLKSPTSIKHSLRSACIWHGQGSWRVSLPVAKPELRLRSVLFDAQTHSPTVQQSVLRSSFVGSLHLGCCFSGFGKGMTGMMKRRWKTVHFASKSWVKTLPRSTLGCFSPLVKGKRCAEMRENSRCRSRIWTWFTWIILIYWYSLTTRNECRWSMFFEFMRQTTGKVEKQSSWKSIMLLSSLLHSLIISWKQNSTSCPFHMPLITPLQDRLQWLLLVEWMKHFRRGDTVIFSLNWTWTWFQTTFFMMCVDCQHFEERIKEPGGHIRYPCHSMPIWMGRMCNKKGHRHC